MMRLILNPSGFQLAKPMPTPTNADAPGAAPPSDAPASDKAKPLSSMQAGEMVCVVRIEANDEDQVRLKRMGVHPGRRMQVAQAGDPMILRIFQTRLGVSRNLANQVFVCTAGGNNNE